MDNPLGSEDLEHGDYSIPKCLTLTFRNVNVNVTAPDAALGETLLSYIDPRQFLGYLGKSFKPKRVGHLSYEHEP